MMSCWTGKRGILGVCFFWLVYGRPSCSCNWWCQLKLPQHWSFHYRKKSCRAILCKYMTICQSYISVLMPKFKCLKISHFLLDKLCLVDHPWTFISQKEKTTVFLEELAKPYAALQTSAIHFTKKSHFYS